MNEDRIKFDDAGHIIIPELEIKRREQESKEYKEEFESLTESRIALDSLEGGMKEESVGGAEEVSHINGRVSYKRSFNEFLFDEEGFILFERKFNIKDHKLIILSKKNGTHHYNYLARRETDRFDKSFITFFHRWLMEKEIFNFSIEHNISNSEIVVHHINFNSSDNRIENLQVMTKEEHNKIHSR